METQCRRRVDIDLDFYENVLWKEMAEIEACCRIGAMMGDGRTVEIEALSDFGRRLGFMSRLADEVEDCLNVKGDLLHRIKYESVPLPLLYAAKSSDSEYKRIEKIVKKNEIHSSDMKSLLESCCETDAFEYVRNLAKKKEEEAQRKLSLLSPSLARTMLLAISMQAYDRVDNLCI